jgi:hypothetical protein
MTAPRPSPKARKPLQRLRKICLALPETTERLSHGEPTWFVRDRKTFVTFSDHHHDDRVGFWCAAPMGTQEALVASAPDRFFVPPYVGHRGWIGVYLDVEQDWDEIAGLVEDAYRQVAPKTLLVQLDGGVVTKGTQPTSACGGSVSPYPRWSRSRSADIPRRPSASGTRSSAGRDRSAGRA